MLKDKKKSHSIKLRGKGKVQGLRKSFEILHWHSLINFQKDTKTS